MTHLKDSLIRAYQWADTIIMAPRCLLCYQSLHFRELLCPRCYEGLPWQIQACLRCGGPLPAACDPEICGICLLTPPPFHKVVSAFHYQPPINHWVISMKFHAELYFLRLFAEAMIQQVKTIYEAESWPAALIPIPLHRWRLFKRGYNQALELSKLLSRELFIPTIYQGIERIQSTRPQTLLPKESRARNVKDAFLVQAKLPNHVAIVDDVLTTGHTVAALTKALFKQGVEKVDVWCVARADSIFLLP